MVQLISKERAITSKQIFISELADVKVFESHLLDYQSWKTYYQDLGVAAEKIRSLIKK